MTASCLANAGLGRLSSQAPLFYRMFHLAQAVLHLAKTARANEGPSPEMYAECQELLQLFGIPYIVAPVEVGNAAVRFWQAPVKRPQACHRGRQKIELVQKKAWSAAAHAVLQSISFYVKQLTGTSGIGLPRSRRGNDGCP
eukprot:scaffold294734_cov15-Tisochrysis_lutea.AAC.1